MNSFRQVLILWMCIFSFGCSPSMNDYKATVKDGITSVPRVAEIQRVFPGSPIDHFITQFGFDRSAPVLWNTEVFFGGRYIFTYQVYVVVDYEKDRILKTEGLPTFSLVRVSRVVYDDTSETWGADFNEDHKFSESDWKKIVAAHGDFSAIGISIDTNRSIPRFDDFVHAMRKDLVHVE